MKFLSEVTQEPQVPSGQPRLTTCPLLFAALHGLVVCGATEKEVASGGQSWLS